MALKDQIILWAVRWCCKHRVSHRELEGMLEERGSAVIPEWTQRCAPEIEKRLRWGLALAMLDQLARERDLHGRARGCWAYLYRAIDTRGDAIDFHLLPTRNTTAAKRFLAKALRGLRASERPKAIHADKAAPMVRPS